MVETGVVAVRRGPSFVDGLAGVSHGERFTLGCNSAMEEQPGEAIESPVHDWKTRY